MTTSSKLISVINGPNLNLLGERDPEIYGSITLAEIITELDSRAGKLGYTISALQSNIEGELVDAVQEAGKNSAGIIINAGGYSHTSVAIRDALDSVSTPAIEVHLSNIYAREEFRQHSLLSPVVKGLICGLGADGYYLALEAVVNVVATEQ